MRIYDADLVGGFVFGQWFRHLPEKQTYINSTGDRLAELQCPRCGTTCIETWQDYSISMWCSRFEFSPAIPLPQCGTYVGGIIATSREAFESVHDFKEAESVEQFLASIGIG